MRVEITCRDPLIEKHCRETFQEKFDEVLSWDRQGPPDGELTMFRNTLEKEARRQQWYDCVPWGDGWFVPFEYRLQRDAEGKPKLLVPEVRIIP